MIVVSRELLLGLAKSQSPLVGLENNVYPTRIHADIAIEPLLITINCARCMPGSIGEVHVKLRSKSPICLMQRIQLVPTPDANISVM